jgi:hypothetical protein
MVNAIQNSKSPAEIQGKVPQTPSAIGMIGRFAIALKLSERGFFLFPLKPNGKRPVRKGWQAVSTRDRDQLRKWFGSGRAYNIGIDTEKSGLVVVDCDVKREGVNGIDNFLQIAGGIEPDTLTVETASGGRHFVFRADPVKSTAGVLAPGVDIKSRGGFVVAPGSVIDGKPYRVVRSAPARPAPAWLTTTIADAYTAAAPVAKLASVVELDTPAAIAEARRYLAEDAPPAIEGQGGDDTTYKVACHVRDMGVSEDMAADLMSEIYDPRCAPPWGEDGIAAKVANAFSYAQNSPGSASAAADFDIIDDWTEPANDNPPAGKTALPRSGISATPFVWRDPAKIPPREWLFGRHYIRRYATGTVAPGGTGKTSLVQTEALSMATGSDLIGGSEIDTPLRVWLWNLEDPLEEVERRFAAAVIHHGVDPATLAGRLFVNSGRDTPLVIATKAKDRLTIVQPVLDALAAEIRANRIDVLIIDPFVSSHGLPENDNSAIDAAVKAWARVAHVGNCAVELVHHSRKLNGETVSADSARGGSAFVDGCRGVRVINRMTEDEASKLGITEPRRFFSMIDDKPNMAPPPAGKRDWYQLVSVQLPNGDDVAAIDRFMPADPLDDVTATDLASVQKRFAEGGHRYDEQSSDWGGYAVAEVLGLDIGIGGKSGRTPEQNAARAKVKDILRKWLAAGDIRVVNGKDSQRKTKSFYASAEAASDEHDKIAA